MKPTRTRTWKRVTEDPVLAGALAFALVATAHAEYTLATATHVHPWVAVAVPGALDLYVIRALARGRDVFLAVLLMVAANVTSHLIAANVLVVDWRVISAVGALAPLLLWRIYALQRVSDASAVLEGPGAESAPDSGEYPEALDTSTFGPAALWGPSALPSAALEKTSTPDHVPSEWSAKVLHLPTSPEFETSTALLPSDMEFLAGAQEYVDYTPEPTVKGLRRALKIGQARAERLLTHLGVR